MRDKDITSLARTATTGEDPEEALRAVTLLREELDRLEAEHVAHALRGGATWSRIARALGISKQAAHKRHRGRRPGGRNGNGAGAVRITDQARRAIALAREEAARLGAPAVGSEHLLLGVLALRQTRTARALEALGITLVGARGVLERGSAGVTNGTQPSGLSRYARAVLERSLRESAEQRRDSIDLAGLVLALLGDGRGGAARTVKALGVEPDAVRRQLQAG